ncbi:MAG: prolipoprotein diacylglyceryl transferase [Kiritimatiellae bacterium]|nr:prolipoprotein diacylglyceryl transferase [Kiritimatiellia bacterium]
MHPICFYLGSRPIYWYGVMTALGFLAAVVHWSLLARRERRDPGFGSDLAFWAMIGGILGARVAYVLAHLDVFLAEPLTILRIDQGGLIYYGGFIGGTLAIVLFARRRHLPLPYIADFTVTGLPLGHALGRIGCFLNGCCYGSPSGALPGVQFPEGSEPWLSYPDTPLHPTQLYEFGWNLLVYAVLFRAYRRYPRNGRTFCLYLLLYPLGRFALEFLRGDQRLHWLGLTAAQVISLGLLAAGAALWAGIRRKAVVHPQR